MAKSTYEIELLAKMESLLEVQAYIKRELDHIIKQLNSLEGKNNELTAG